MHFRKFGDFIIRKTVEKCVTYWALFGGALLLVIVLITGLNVAGFSLNRIFRIFGSSFPGISGYEDIVTLLVGVAAVTMFPFCQYQKGNIAVDLFMTNAPRWLENLVEKFSSLLMLATVVFLAWMMVLGTLQVKEDGDLSQVLGIPVWPFMAISIVSMVLWVATCLIDIFPDAKIVEEERNNNG